LLENVKNLQSHDKGKTFQIIYDKLTSLDYHVKYEVLNTCKITDIPQNRERIYIVCFKNKEMCDNFNFVFREDGFSVPPKKVIGKFLREGVLVSYMSPKGLYTVPVCHPCMKDACATGDLSGVPKFLRGTDTVPTGQFSGASGGMKKINEFLDDPIMDKYYYTNRFKVYDSIKEGVIKSIDENVLYQYRRYYVRENKNNVCPTLTANMGGGGHNVPLLKDSKGIRKLTPRECFNLQGFPSTYKLPVRGEISDAALYKLAGNAVSVPVVELIARKLSVLIDRYDHRLP